MSTFQDFRAKIGASTVVHVAFAFLLMGGWAMFANRAHPLPDALLAGAVQGTLSSILTLCLKKLLEWMSSFMDCRRPCRPAAAHAGEGAGGPYHRLFQLVLPPLITAAIILLILFTAHTLAGTPEVGATIAFPFAVSTTYAIIYNWSLWRAANGR